MHPTLAEAAASADAELPRRLGLLLRVPEGQRFSELERLRRPPTRTSGPAMVRALDRASDVLAVGARAAQVQAVPANRLAALARYGLTAKAPALRELTEPPRTATLLAAARHLEAAAVDDALDLFDVLMATRLISAARRASAAERLAAMPRLERASATLAGAARALLDVLAAAGTGRDGDGRLDVGAAWAAVEQVAPREQVLGAVAVVQELVGSDLTASSAEAAMRESLASRYGVVCPFLELLAEVLILCARRSTSADVVSGCRSVCEVDVEGVSAVVAGSALGRLSSFGGVELAGLGTALVVEGVEGGRKAVGEHAAADAAQELGHEQALEAVEVGVLVRELGAGRGRVEVVGDDAGPVACLVAPAEAQEGWLVGGEDLAEHDAVPAGEGLADEPEVGADLGLEAFWSPALAGRGPQWDQGRVGEGLPDDRPGPRIVLDDHEPGHRGSPEVSARGSGVTETTR